MKRLLIKKDDLQKNIDTIKKKAGECEIIGVLKGNGYGLGLVELAEILRENDINFFAVTEPEDVRKLRENGFNESKILLLRSTVIADEVKMILENHATATIGSYEAAVLLNGMAKENNVTVEAHIEIDTGMGRYGFFPSETEKILSIYKFMKNIEIKGIYTHFPLAFASKKATIRQCEILCNVCEEIRNAGFEPGVVHAANSSALMLYDLSKYKFGAVRIGSAITGRSVCKKSMPLTKVGVLEARVVETRWLPAKTPIGYGNGFVTKQPTKIAVIGAGYCDGFLAGRTRDIYRLRDTLRYMFAEFKRWLFKKNYTVEINGKSCRILGHVGMAHTVADITNTECAPGDPVYMNVSPAMVDSSVERLYI